VDPWDPNLVIDGETNYREEEILRAFLAEAMAILAAGGELPMSLRLLLEMYFDAIAA